MESAGHELTEIAIVATVALGCGLILSRLKQPAIVGYILAGIVLGPSVLGFVTDRDQINFLAELGVLLLLFAIGMELDIRDFKPVIRFAFIGTGMQIAIASVVMFVLGYLFGWSWERSILVGFGIALSSTAVAIKLLEDVGELKTEVGKRAIAILIAQDLAVVPMMLFVATMAPNRDLVIGDLLPVAGAVIILGGLMWFLGRRGRLRLPFREFTRGQLDLIAIAALALCFAAAAISGLFGMSTAYGAFLAGLVLGNSTDRKIMLRSTLPIQGVLLMVFFLSIGLLIDLNFIWENIGQIVVMLLLVTLGKTALNVGVLRFLKEPWPRAWLGGVALGQVGEFSFVLAALGVSVGAITDDGYRLFVAVIALSLMISPLWLDSARRLHRLADSAESFQDLMSRIYPSSSAQTRSAYAWSRTRFRRLGRRHRDALPASLMDDDPP
jgi:monovalent cation:H+ antiporter-2, CPA2 family